MVASTVADNPDISTVTDHKYEIKDFQLAGPNYTKDNYHEGAVSPANNVGGLHRRLGSRQIQLVAIGGSIGTGLFIAIGTGLYKGGPGSLLLAFIIQSLMVGMLNSCLAEMTCAWPEYISTVAAAVKYPCIYIKSAFKNVYWHFNIFFVRGALCVGTLIAYNDSTLVAALESGELSAAVSPYIIAIQNLGIDVIPYIISALIATTVFPANNTYNYTATRALYGVAVNTHLLQD
ncbi:hypothetical protein BDV36DRAFT_301242 [Aspergillus pseudocaelatus]|uniref:Amino acid permease/ SLC12A domain-containing protein n=1 Tax=Aspergillus pseudocaelatus TaxID=1825620 RepID=A0ABQ6W622_9EURO|nr:hypothetical protein BDV36DRAFT_301242 [Aspergillus pseudocaelatus]